MTTCVRIEILDNGYTLSFDDPEIRAQNRKSTSNGWTDPSRTRVYSTIEAMKTELDTLLPLLQPEPMTQVAEYETAIQEAFAKDDTHE